MKIRQATEADLRRWFDGKVPVTMRAYVCDHEGELLGLFGIAMCRDHAQAFSDYRPGMRDFEFTMGRAALQFAGMLARMTVPVLAVCSKREPTAPRLLERLGFVHQQDEVWRYG